jgi:hypothetical protein
MDAVCVKGDWDVVVQQNESGKLEGILVYHYRKVLGQTFILMPPMCFYNGIYLFYREGMNNYQKLSFQNRVSASLIKALPSFAFYYQQYHTTYDNWAPLMWEGFKQSTRYTYRLNTNTTKENLWNSLKANLRRNITKAENRCMVKECSFEEFWNALSFSYKTRTNPFDKKLLYNIYTALYATDSCQLNLCIDKENNQVLAGSFIVFDKSCSYYLSGFYNPTGKEKAGLSYLLWHSLINNPNEIFDFEGSMIKEIEYFFRAFGARWVPHYRIWKIDSLFAPIINWKFKRVLNA